jgi:hypothetical protein
VIHVL